MTNAWKLDGKTYGAGWKDDGKLNPATKAQPKFGRN